jgi:hypothetical protein
MMHSESLHEAKNKMSRLQKGHDDRRTWALVKPTDSGEDSRLSVGRHFPGPRDRRREHLAGRYSLLCAVGREPSVRATSGSVIPPFNRRRVKFDASNMAIF